MLPWDLHLTPEQFERVCQANPDAVLELDADGQLMVMTPTGGKQAAATASSPSSWRWPCGARDTP